MTPQEFDAQSPVKIDKWLDIESSDAKDMDSDRDLTKKMIRIGFEDGWMVTDSLGRIWGKSESKGTYFPFHFEYGKQLIGYRIAAKAAN